MAKIQIKDKQITEIPKYQLEKYINTYQRRREILITEIPITEVQKKYKLQENRNTH